MMMVIITAWNIRGENEAILCYQNYCYLYFSIYHNHSADFMVSGNNTLTSGKIYANQKKHRNSLRIF